MILFNVLLIIYVHNRYFWKRIFMENMRVHEKGRLIGRGTTAEVYEWGKDRVLKLFYEKLSDTWINNEIRIGNAVYEAGVPAPAVLDTVVVNGRRGAIFERIPGQSMMKMVGLEQVVTIDAG
jgi:tRNA A-37 threonylcarbamoyl transferase component Bud32